MKALPRAHRNCLSSLSTISTWLSPKVKSVLTLPDLAEWHLAWQTPSLLDPCRSSVFTGPVPQPLLSLPFTAYSSLSCKCHLHSRTPKGRVLPGPFPGISDVTEASVPLCGDSGSTRLSLPSEEHSFPQSFPTGCFSFRSPMSVKGNSTVAGAQPKPGVTTGFLP